MPKPDRRTAKPVTAWAVLQRGRLVPSLMSRFKSKLALIPQLDERHVRVVITEQPARRAKKARKV